MALLWGLQCCASIDVRGILVETDCKMIVYFLLGSAIWPWRYQDELQQIKSLLSALNGSLKFREFIVAYSLASMPIETVALIFTQILLCSEDFGDKFASIKFLIHTFDLE